MLPEPDSVAPIYNIHGDKVALGPIRRDLIPLYHRWFNDFDITVRTSGLCPLSFEAEEEWFNKASRSKTDHVFTIYERETAQPIGDTSLFDIHPVHRSAVFGIVIGEKDRQSQGFGTEATRLMLDFGFNGLNLHSVRLEVFSFNERAIRAYLNAGFHEVGRLRESHFAAGELHDTVLMDCLASEFESPVLARLLP